MSLVAAGPMPLLVRTGLVLASAAGLAVGGAGPAFADPEPEYDITLPEGQACAGFGVGIDLDGGHRILREFEDAEGNVVRVLETGRGYELTFTNLETDETLTLPSNGSVARTIVEEDGTTTVSSMGHNVLIFFPSDVPAGPSTTLYVGRVVYTVDADGVFTLVSSAGRHVDLCALLA